MEKIEQLMVNKISDALNCCYDNVSDIENLEKIYLFLWNEGNNIYVEFDYKVDGKIVDNKAISDYASKMYDATVKDLKTALLSLQEMFHEENYDLPTAYKVVYDCNLEDVDIDLEYESLENGGKWSGEYYLEWIKSN